MPNTPNYTLGRGEIHFARFKPTTKTPDGYRYIGNTPELALTIETEMLDHFSSDRGIREKDASIPLETTRKGSMTADDIQLDNLALFFFGEKATVTIAPAPTLTETLIDVHLERTYQIGISDANPAGLRNITTLVVKVGAVVKAITTDYLVDLELGIITIVDGGTILELDDVILEYGTSGATYDRVISGTLPVEGAMRFQSFNPEGKLMDYFFPYVKVSPNGDFALKSDEWQSIPFNIEVLKLPNREAIYVNGRPYTP